VRVSNSHDNQKVAKGFFDTWNDSTATFSLEGGSGAGVRFCRRGIAMPAQTTSENLPDDAEYAVAAGTHRRGGKSLVQEIAIVR